MSTRLKLTNKLTTCPTLKLSAQLMAMVGLVGSLSACGEVTELNTSAQRYSSAEFAQVLEPRLAQLGCEECHSSPTGGFKWDVSGTPAASDSNLLNVQRKMNYEDPSASPLLIQLSPPKLNHPLFFCPDSCLYQYLLAWGSPTDGPVDYPAIQERCRELEPSVVQSELCQSPEEPEED